MRILSLELSNSAAAAMQFLHAAYATTATVIADQRQSYIPVYRSVKVAYYSRAKECFAERVKAAEVLHVLQTSYIN